MSVRGVLVAAVLVLAVSGCSDGAAPPVGQACLPEPLSADPATVVVGQQLTVSSPPFRCDASYPEGHVYRLTLGLVGRADPVSLGSAPVEQDGSFRATVQIPAAAPPGEAYVEVRGSALDECDDGEGSCAGYAVRLELLPAA